MPKRTRILFIGNSFTARNNLPQLLAEMVEAGGNGSLEWELIWAGGASLRRHLNKGEAEEKLWASKWDWVSLQEQSTLPLKNATRTTENIRDFDELIRSAKAKTLLYMTWARRDVPEKQQEFNELFSFLGKEFEAAVVPAGAAWQRCLQSEPKIVLHDKDGNHPNLAGSYLAACTFYVRLFLGGDKDIPPIDIELDDELAGKLRHCAIDAVHQFE